MLSDTPLFKRLYRRMTNSFEIELSHNLSTMAFVPSEDVFKTCLTHTSSYTQHNYTVNFTTVSNTKMASLNINYRKKTGPTNVLTFPEENTLNSVYGSIYFAPDIINSESSDRSAHWNLLIIHSLLHLSGYTHHNDEDTKVMQNAEQNILNSLKYG